MSTFKFVCRDTEISEVISAVRDNSTVILHCQTKSGLTHFLKRIMQLLWDDDTVCFYIDGESQLTISEQIIGQTMMYSKNDSPVQNQAAKILKKHDKGNLVFSVVTSCLYALDVIPLLPNIGTIANSLISSIKDTIDTDREHIADFKTEKAICRFCEDLIKRKKQLFLLIDNPQKIRAEDNSFLFLLLKRFNIHILFPFSMEAISYEMEFISKFLCTQNLDSSSVHKITAEFNRPDDSLIRALYNCYGVEFNPNRITYYEQNARNIHVIMADIFGLPINIGNLEPALQFLVKVLATVGCPIPESILYQILRTENIHSTAYSDSFLQSICNQACEVGIVSVENTGHEYEKSYILSKQLMINSASQISFVEKQSIISACIKAMDYKIDFLSLSLLEFAIIHLEHDYSHAKKYILAYTRLLYDRKRYPLMYLDKLNYFDNINELIFAVGVYYNYGVYDKPYRLLKNHKEFSRKQQYRIAQALICERLHTDDYVRKLECLFDEVKDLEKKCLIASVLFVAYLNTDEAKKYMCFFDKNSRYYYLSFQHCQNYYYLLRNVSYYIEDLSQAMSNYEKCLTIFLTKDPVNYNRTISNYICYLMRHDNNEKALSRLKQLSQESERILDYCDPAYSYLSNNFGIYLMRYTDKDPTAFFTSIPFSAGTTETPYIYAQVNLSLYYLKSNPNLALQTMIGIEDLIQNTTVPRTKQFYAINRALIEYANGMTSNEWIDEIIRKPIRGNIEYAQSLCQRYDELLKGQIPFNQEFIKELCLPGYLFYRYFAAENLLANF